MFFFNEVVKNYLKLKRTYTKIISKFGNIEVLINNIGSGEGTSNVIPEISEWKKFGKKFYFSL